MYTESEPVHTESGLEILYMESEGEARKRYRQNSIREVDPIVTEVDKDQHLEVHCKVDIFLANQDMMTRNLEIGEKI